VFIFQVSYQYFGKSLIWLFQIYNLVDHFEGQGFFVDDARSHIIRYIPKEKRRCKVLHIMEPCVMVTMNGMAALLMWSLRNE
jgi:hypothetical protein